MPGDQRGSEKRDMAEGRHGAREEMVEFLPGASVSIETSIRAGDGLDDSNRVCRAIFPD